MTSNLSFNFGLRGIMMSSVLVSSFLHFEGMAKASAFDDAEKLDLTQTHEMGQRIASRGTPPPPVSEMEYISTEESLEKGYEVISSPKWETGDNSPRNYSVPKPNALNVYKDEEQENAGHLTIEKYNDYDGSAYWAKDMNWAIQNGLIMGYQNQIHPTTTSKGVGNWINPNGNLTENQMLIVLSRYKNSSNIINVSINSNNDVGVAYIFAKEHRIPTNGSVLNPSSQQVTRGQMAQALVSMHYGKEVSVQQAVDFMYANGLSTGTNPSKGPTLENFDINSKLVRSHIVSFLGRYNDLMDSGNIKDTLYNENFTNPSAPEFEHTKYDYTKMYGIFDTSKKFTKDGIKVSYKNHTYNVKNQAEYDAVMNHVVKTISGKTLYDGLQFSEANKQFDPDHAGQLINNAKLLERVMQGEKFTVIKDRTHPSYRSEENIMALKANTMLESNADTFANGVSFETLAKFDAAFMYLFAFRGGGSSIWGPPESAYDHFIKKEVDCTSSAYAGQALLDALGYNTAVVHSPKAYHDFLIVELENHWYTIDFGELKEFTKDSVKTGDFIKFAPAKNANKLSFIKIL